MVRIVSGDGHAVARIAGGVTATLIVVFAGLLWLVGLACGDKRREYVTHISEHALETVQVFFGTAAGGASRPGANRSPAGGLRSIGPRSSQGQESD